MRNVKILKRMVIHIAKSTFVNFHLLFFTYAVLSFISCSRPFQDEEVKPKVDTQTSDWRSYQMYFPKLETYTVTPKVSHDASIVWFKDRWIAMYDDGNEQEGQRIRQSFSFDLVSWSEPTQPFVSTSDNEIDQSRAQYQPSLVIADGVLLCVWQDSPNSYISRLESPAGIWTTKKLYGTANAQYPLPSFEGKSWTVFAGNNGLILQNGRIMVPVTMVEYAPTVLHADRAKRDGVIFSDDRGITWSYSSAGTINETGAWEATIWEPETGIINMVSRYNRSGEDVIIKPTENMKFTSSTDNGKTWLPQVLVPIETSMSRMHAVNKGKRNMLAANDWAVQTQSTVVNRKNMTLFFSRGNGYNFSPAVNFDANVVNTTSYPQIAIKDNYAVVIYTRSSYTSTWNERQTIVTKISPLPDDDQYYIFPRENRGQIKMGYIDNKDVIYFYNDYSSASIDLDANTATTDKIHLSFDFKVSNGKHTILSLDYPNIRLIAENGMVKLQKSDSGEEIECGTYNDWTNIELVTGKGITSVRVNGGTEKKLNAAPLGPIRAFFGQNYYQGLLEKPDTHFFIDLKSIKSKVEKNAKA